MEKTKEELRQELLEARLVLATLAHREGTPEYDKQVAEAENRVKVIKREMAKLKVAESLKQMKGRKK